MNYKNKLWKIFSLYIRLRDADVKGNCRCISCGKIAKYTEMDAGHFIPKSKGNAIYFEEDNVHAQCRYCNSYLHGNLYFYGKALEDKIGKKAIDNLFKLSKTIKKITENEYKKMIEYYTTNVTELKKVKT